MSENALEYHRHAWAPLLQTFLGVPASENSMYGRVECALRQSNL